ncbi:MAG: hypothetical protein ACI9O6_001035 [Glaciecola sp.]|jgi:hypothetical protein
MHNLLKVIVSLIIISGALISSASYAQQKHFYKLNTNAGVELNYQWLSLDGPRQLKFTLLQSDIEALPNSAPAYNPMLAQNHIHRTLLEYAQTIDPKVARINIKRSGSSLNMEVSGSSETKINEITETLSSKHTQAETEYLAKNYYTPFQNEFGQMAIKQDHRRYAIESSDNLESVVESIKNQLNKPNNSREFINFTLDWLQTIPYDTLENRISSNGSGFAAPKQLILNNKGDCDSKSTLFLALLKAYNPNISVKMIFLPQHALVGISMKAEKNDIAIEQDGMTYILAEPTGAAQLPLGEIAPSSMMYVRNRQFTTEMF